MVRRRAPVPRSGPTRRAARARARRRRAPSLEWPHRACPRGLSGTAHDPQGAIAARCEPIHTRDANSPGSPPSISARSWLRGEGLRMDFERAFDTLGLAPGASEQDIESAYRHLCADFDSRISRVTSLALRDRYAAARAELDGARAMAIQAARLRGEPRASGDDSSARVWAVLGLAVGASPLEVASAYVSLCEELDRELAAAPTEALRKRCLEARAEIDSAYQHCAAAPLGAEAGKGASAGYETQVALATFEAPPAEFSPNPALIRILADPDPPTRRRRHRRRPLRR